MATAERRGEPVSKSTSSSLTSRGTGLMKNRVLADDIPGELEFSRSLKMNPSPVESHSAVNVHEVSREDFCGGGLTTGELGRFRWTPLNRAPLRRIFLTFPEPEACALATACVIARHEDRLRGCPGHKAKERVLTLPFADDVEAAGFARELPELGVSDDDDCFVLLQALSTPLDGSTASVGRAAAMFCEPLEPKPRRRETSCAGGAEKREAERDERKGSRNEGGMGPI